MSGISVWAEPHEDRTDAIFAMLQRPEWHADAACRGQVEVMFPRTRGNAGQWAAARALCMKCPVRRECHEAANARGEAYGMWGGHIRQPTADKVDFAWLLSQRDDWSVNELSEATGVAVQSVRRWLRAAVAKGFVSERVDPTNRSRRLYGVAEERRSA